MAVLRKRLSTGNPIGRPKGVVETKPRVRLEFRSGEGPSKAHQRRVREEEALKKRLADTSWPRCSCGCGAPLPDLGAKKTLRGHGPAASVRRYLTSLLDAGTKAGVIPPDEGILKKARTQGRGFDTFPKAVAELSEFLQRLKATGVVTEFSPVTDMDALHGDLRAFGVALQSLHGLGQERGTQFSGYKPGELHCLRTPQIHWSGRPTRSPSGLVVLPWVFYRRSRPR